MWNYLGKKRNRTSGFARLLVLLSLVAGLVVSSAPLASQPAQAMDVQTLEVWGISGGIVSNPKEWKFRQSTNSSNDLGSASAADPALDDSSWATRTLRWREFPGSNVANHFRKDFELGADSEIGVTAAQIQGIRVQLQYDDTAVMYLNGHEVYRSIRGNLDPNYTPYAIGDDIPRNVYIPFGGAEEFYVFIPNSDDHNECEAYPGCTRSPYGGPNPPEIPLIVDGESILNEGVNTWSVTTWNQSGGGSGDSSLNHVFELLVVDQPPNPIFINEVVASNDGSWPVEIDGDPTPETPDWFELVNASAFDVDLAGWTISDSSASWVFPSVTIEAGDYLVVAANDGDVTNPIPPAPLQTNFKISTTADSLKLTNDLGVVADEYVSITDQFTDNSFGRPNDSGTPTYLAATTPGAANSGAGTDFTPILRPFVDRIYNQGEPISHQVEAFDPDGDALSFALTGAPSWLNISPTGLITGTATTPGTVATTITVTDADNDFASQEDVEWIVVPAPAGPPPIVLNEYNAVAGTRELLSGGVVGNGGDWFEFLVVEDELDLRGFTFEMWDRKGVDAVLDIEDQLRPAASVTVADAPELSIIPAGTIVTISEANPNDFTFDADSDWHINLQIDTTANGTFFEPATGSTFNSTRRASTVLIKDSSGTVVTPLSGETEAWDAAGGGVSGSEVMKLCVNPSAGTMLDPIVDYRDSGESSFGLMNTCVYPDLVDPVPQDLTALRATASLGLDGGDVNCDGLFDLVDAIFVLQYTVSTRFDTGVGSCFFDRGSQNQQFYLGAANLNGDATVDILDALGILQCTVSLPLPFCPPE